MQRLRSIHSSFKERTALPVITRAKLKFMSEITSVEDYTPPSPKVFFQGGSTVVGFLGIPGLSGRPGVSWYALRAPQDGKIIPSEVKKSAQRVNFL